MLGDAQGMVDVEGEMHDRVAKANVLRLDRDRDQELLRTAEGGVAGEEVMLDDVDRVEAQLVGEDTLLERLVESPLDRAWILGVLARDLVEE